MRNFYLLFLLYSCSLFSQVGIGTTTPNGALDVVSTNQGLLIPRVELTSTNVSAPVTNPASGVLANSTLIYNSSTNGVFPNNVFPGFYYWDGLKWVRLNTESSWLVNGNANTSPATNFLGTLDDNDLVFKRNNVFSGKISSSNTAFGVNAFSNTSSTGLRSVAMGVNALKTNTSGNDNIALGYGALENNTTGIQNTAIGTSSLSLNSSGGYNVAIGYEALTRNTTGILNVAIGGSSLYNNLSGRNNVAVGKSSLERNFTGIDNTGLGNYSLFNNQSGASNVGIGKSALERNNNGSNNVAIGNSSLFNVEGSNNTSIGHESQLNNSTGQGNTSLGYRSLYTNNGGGNNTAIGLESLYGNTSGARNTALGERAGSGITSGSNNIFVGYNSGLGVTTGANNTVIGSNLTLPAGTTGNIVLADGLGNRRINVDQNGNVGIATTTPTSKLEVNGSATNTTAFNAGASTTINLANSNLAITSASTNAITLTNLKDGGAYTLVFSSTTATAGDVVFTATGLTFVYMGTYPRISGKRHIYSVIVFGTVCYVSMSVEN